MVLIWRIFRQSKTIIFRTQNIFEWNKLSIYSSQIEQEAMDLNDSKEDLGWQLGETFSAIGIAEH